MYYKSPFNHLKKFLSIVEKKIPLHIKIVAEIRFIWKDIVGEKMAQRSQVAKCEYVTKKDEQGTKTGEFHRRLIVFVKDSATQTAMTTYVADYLESIPKKFKIHSLRFVYTHNPFVEIEVSPAPQKPFLEISDEERQQIINQVQDSSITPDTAQAVIDYLILCKSMQNKKK